MTSSSDDLRLRPDWRGVHRLRNIRGPGRFPPEWIKDVGTRMADATDDLWTGHGHRGAARILVSIMLAAGIPVLLFGVWAGYLTAEREREDARRAAHDTAMRVADHVASDLEQELGIAQALVSSAALDAPDLEAFHGEARRLAETRPLWETVSLFDADGEQVLNILRSMGDPLGSPRDPGSLEDALRRSEPVIGSIGDEAQASGERTIPIRIPVLRDDALRFVLSVGLLPASIASTLRDAGAPDGWVGTIADAEGRIVARSIPQDSPAGERGSQALRAAVERGEDGFYSGRMLDGLAVETVYRGLPELGGWSVHFAIPSRDLDAPVQRSLWILVAGGLLSLLMAASLAWLVARELAQRRLRETTRASRAIQASEDRAAVAVDAAGLGTWCWDAERDEVLGSARTARLLGLPEDDDGSGGRWPTARFIDAVHVDDRRAFRDAIDTCKQEESSLDLEFRAPASSGWRWLKATGRVANGHDGTDPVIHGVIADIDAAKRFEAERRGLQRRLAVARENEQRRIARELHDQVGQTVTGLSLALKGLERSLERDAPEQLSSVLWLQELADAIGRDIHRASSDLRPTALDDLGLRRALLAHAQEWSRRFDLDVDVEWHGAEDRLPAEIETALYRVVQEAVTNVVKHAGASTVSIVVERRQADLRLVIEDDGRGFATCNDAPEGASQDTPRPLGLSGMRERVSLLDGVLGVETEPGGGTMLFISVPVREHAA